MDGAMRKFSSQINSPGNHQPWAHNMLVSNLLRRNIFFRISSIAVHVPQEILPNDRPVLRSSQEPKVSTSVAGGQTTYCSPLLVTVIGSG